MLNRIIFALALLADFSAFAADWPRWRGPEANGISSETAAPWSGAGPKKLWQAEVGLGFSSISVAQGRAYTMGFVPDSDVVTCLDAITGKLIWKHAEPGEQMENVYEGGPNATPTVDGGTVFTFTRRGDVCALDAATGTLIWRRELAKELGAKMPTWGFSSSPLVEGRIVVLNLGDAGTGLDRKTGEVIWKSGPGASGYATAVPFDIQGRHLVALFSSQELVALDPQTGAVAWRHPWKTTDDINAADPVILGDRLLLSSGDNRGAALLQLTGGPPTVLWENKNLRAQFTPPVILGGFIYGLDGNAGEHATLRCIDPANGNVKWTGPVVGTGGLLAANGRLVVLSDKGELALYDASPAGFKALARAQILGGKCWTNPALSGGRLYARNAKGTLVCYELAAGK
jgi:outer membrane protein assembly factor BamB